MLKKAMELAATKQQKTAILRRAGAIYTLDTLHFVLPYLDQPEFDQATAETIVAIAHHKEVRHAAPGGVRRRSGPGHPDQQESAGDRRGEALQGRPDLIVRSTCR